MNRSIKAAALIAVVPLLVGASGDGCMPTPCEGLSASAKDKQAAADGYEVEREDKQGQTCELSRDGKTWKVDD